MRMDRPECKKAQAVKNLKSQNLRDNMSEAELIFTALAELSTRKSQKVKRPKEKLFVYTAFLRIIYNLVMYFF